MAWVGSCLPILFISCRSRREGWRGAVARRCEIRHQGVRGRSYLARQCLPVLQSTAQPTSPGETVPRTGALVHSTSCSRNPAATRHSTASLNTSPPKELGNQRSQRGTSLDVAMRLRFPSSFPYFCSHGPAVPCRLSRAKLREFSGKSRGYLRVTCSGDVINLMNLSSNCSSNL